MHILHSDELIMLVFFMIKIESYPQYELYKFTKGLYFEKDRLVPKNCDNRCVYSTIINRCYYSSYLYALEWLEDKHDFKPLLPWEYPDGEYISEHNQVINMLKNLHLFDVHNFMLDLFSLRKKADYKPFSYLSDGELDKAIEFMENIFDNLKF